MSRNLRDAVADHFRAHPGEWISMQTLAGIAGTGGWRSRVSDCRAQLGLNIENRTARIKLANGQKITRSDYRYIPRLVVKGQADLFAEAS